MDEFEAQNLVYFKRPELQLGYYSHMRRDEKKSTQNPAGKGKSDKE